MIQRQRYLDRLISKKENGLIKVITGVGRCGKSYLLFEIYHQYLRKTGVDEDHIIALDLGDGENIRYRNPLELWRYIRSLITDRERMYYVFLDDILKVTTISNPYLPGGGETIGISDVLLEMMKIKNIDLYVTGVVSKTLTSDFLTELGELGEEIRVYPLSYKEFYGAFGGSECDAWQEYSTYGGMPLVLLQKTPEDMRKYLHDLSDNIYPDDIMSRYKIVHDKHVLCDMLDVFASSVGSLTSPKSIAKTFGPVKGMSVARETVSRYLDFFVDSFILDKAKRYDVKRESHIGSPMKYYYCDVGLCNAVMNFRHRKEDHIMENIIYNELRVREFDVDAGAIELKLYDAGKKLKHVQSEFDFVVNKGSKRYYIQSAFAIPDEETREEEIRTLLRIQDQFKKIVVVREDIEPRHDENGILYIGIEQFLLDEAAMDL